MARNTNKILYSVAICSNDEFVNANDAIKGCEYFCPVCKSKLILRKSGNTGKNSKRPHFAHKSTTQNCTPESALHYTFKTLVFNKIRSFLKENRALDFEWDCQFCTEHHKGNLLKKISDVKLEYNLGKCQPDIALLDAHENVHAVIEVVVTHKPEEQAIQFYNENDIILIEHVLKSDLDLWDIDEKLSNPGSVSTCFNKKCKQCGNFLINLHLYCNHAPCYRCGSELMYSYVSSQTHNMVRGGGSYLTPEDFNAKEIELARSQGVILKKHNSRQAGYSYLANTCNSCNSFIGSHYLFSDYIAQENEAEMAQKRLLVGTQCDACEEKNI